SRTSRFVCGSSLPGALGSGICLTQTSTFMAGSPHYAEIGSDRTDVLSWKIHAAHRVRRDRGEVRAEPRPAHGIQLVAQPVPGLLSQLCLLLCPRPRKAGRPRSGCGLLVTGRRQGNVPELLRLELSRPGWKREMVAFGTATDPYQPIEGSYKLTRRCLMAFRDYRTPIGLITKGTMVIRDVDVLVELSRRAKTTVSFSIPTIDEEVWARTEPGTPPPR